MIIPFLSRLRGFAPGGLVMAVLSIVALGHATDSGMAEGPSLEAKSDVPTNQETFETNCSGCHGADLTGGQGPSLVDATWIHGSDDASIMRVLSAGVIDKGMPAFGETLTDAERRGLVAYIREKGASAEAGTTAFPTDAQKSELESYRVETVADKDLVTPWSMVFLSKSTMLVSERPGRLRVVHTDGKVDAPVTGAPKITQEFIHGGMLGLALAPDYEKSGWIYVGFTDEQPDTYGEAAKCAGRATCFTIATQIKIIRGRLRNNALVDQQTIWQGAPTSYRVTPNFGGRLAFGADGMLYFSVGDRVYSVMEAQDLTSPNGKIHRVAPDGSIPADNPYVGVKGAVPSIWSIGHRNIEGFAADPRTKYLWSSEHGPRGGDELNLIRPGGNYGWPYLTYGMGYDGRPFDRAYPIGHSQAIVPVPDESQPVDTSKMIEPTVHWTPSIAVSAMAFYEGKAFPNWRDSLFVTSLKQKELLRLTVEGDKVTHQEQIFRWHGRLRDIVTGPDGAIYLVINEPDAIVKLVPATPAGKGKP